MLRGARLWILNCIGLVVGVGYAGKSYADVEESARTASRSVLDNRARRAGRSAMRAE